MWVICSKNDCLPGNAFSPPQPLVRWVDFIHPRGFPGGSDSKETACNMGDLGLIPGFGKIPWRREGLPTPVFCLENSMDCTVLGVEKSRTRLSDFYFPNSHCDVGVRCQFSQRADEQMLRRSPGRTNGPQASVSAPTATGFL